MIYIRGTNLGNIDLNQLSVVLERIRIDPELVVGVSLALHVSTPVD